MRRKRQQLEERECVSILQRATSGTLALLGDGGYPYAVPVSFVYEDGCLYFHSAVDGHKIDAIRNYNMASFCVIDKDDVHAEEYTTYYRSVIAFGHIHIIEDENEKMRTARILGNRYNPNQNEPLNREMEKGLSRMLMICLKIDHMTGKESIELTKSRNH